MLLKLASFRSSLRFKNVFECPDRQNEMHRFREAVPLGHGILLHESSDLGQTWVVGKVLIISFPRTVLGSDQSGHSDWSSSVRSSRVRTGSDTGFVVPMIRQAVPRLDHSRNSLDVNGGG